MNINRVTDHCIEQLRQGEQAALKEIYERYYHPLVLFGLKYIQDQIVAEDLVQEIFIKVWAKRNFFFSETALRTFLYKSIRNACINHLEHQQVHDRFSASVLSLANNEDHFFNQVIEEETHRLLYEAIERLPDVARKIYRMSLEGYKNNEIANDLNISVNTVKTHKLRAMKFLRESFKKLGILLLSI
jgi:RNA polymerase sigma-70 factor (ECF subfamily)